MLIPPNSLIVVLGIVMSFILFAQGQKFNLETTEYGQLVRECKTLNYDYERCFVRRSPEIRKRFGVPYWELETRRMQQMVFLVIPAVVLIVALFVGFSVDKNEKYLTLIALTPLFLSFLRYYPYAPEKWLIPLYLFFAAVIAYFVIQFKRLIFEGNR